MQNRFRENGVISLVDRLPVRLFDVPVTACLITGAPLEGLPCFRLARRRGTVEIWVTVAWGDRAYQWELGRAEGHVFAEYAAARQFVAVWAARYGQSIQEVKTLRKSYPRGSHAHRALMASGGCLESWLTSDAPELFATAMTRCGSPAQDCHHAGRCQYGDCNMQMDISRPECPGKHDQEDAADGI